MATYEEYCNALITTVSTTVTDPANTDGKVTLTVLADDDKRYLDTALTELTVYFRTLADGTDTDGNKYYVVTPSGQFWFNIQTPNAD